MKYLIILIVLYSNVALAKNYTCTPIAEINCATCEAQLYVECESGNLTYSGHIHNDSRPFSLEVVITNVTTLEEQIMVLKSPADRLYEYHSSRIVENPWFKKMIKKNGVKLSDHTSVDLTGFEIKGPLVLYQDAWMSTPEKAPAGWE